MAQSLLMRFDHVRNPIEPEPEVVEDRSQRVIRFGKKMLGKTYAEAYADDGYVRWAVAHLVVRPTVDHADFLKYVENQITDEETGKSTMQAKEKELQHAPTDDFQLDNNDVQTSEVGQFREMTHVWLDSVERFLRRLG